VAVATAVNTALRRTILATVENPFVERTVRRHGMKLGARRFVAAETLEEALDVLARLNVQGLLANTTILGEEVSEPDEARAVASAYLRVLERIRERELRVNVALKLTHLGLLIDEELAFANVARVVDHAAALGNFVRIDMEHSAVVDATLRIYRRLRDGGRDAVGAVLQSYLYRSERDLEELLPLRPNLRIVKGAYLEPPSVAYPRKRDVDAAFARLVESGMGSGAYIAVATHDERLLEHAIATAERNRIGRDGFELQMLYGVRPHLQLALVQRGFKVRIATPYGPEWYPFFMRRLAERPANVLFLVRNLVRR
jgi:proline dehydrogenase